MRQSEKKNMVVTVIRLSIETRQYGRSGSDIGYRENGEGSDVTVMERLNASARAGKTGTLYT